MLAALLTELLAAVAAAVGLFGLGYVALRKPTVFVALSVAVWIPAIAVTEALPLSLHLSGLKISAPDVLAAVMAAAAVVRLLSHGARSLAGGLVLLLLALLALHVARGIADFGLQTAANSARSTFYFIAALAYAATVPGGWSKSVWKVIVAAGIMLALVAVPFWLSRGLGSAGTMVVHNGELVTARPIVAPGALLIVQAAIVSLAIRWPSRKSAAYVAAGCVAAVLLLQHRTVWVAGLAVATIGFFLWTARAGRRGDRLALAAVGVLLLLLPLAGWAFARSDPLVRSATEVTYGNSTFNWRETGWRELLESHHSASTVAFGEPSGTSFNRRIRRTDVDVSAHNGYLETYLRLGVPGLLLLLWLGVTLWLRRGRISAATGLGTPAVGLLLLTQALFSITFSLDAIQGIVAGVLVAGLGVVDRRLAPTAAREPIRALGGQPA